MKPFLATFFGGATAMLFVSAAQILDASTLVTLLSAGVGGGLGTYAGQKVLSVS